jgi:hypothetical protein
MEWFYLALRYFFTAIPFVFAMLFALVGFWMVVATASRVTSGAWTVGIAFLIETAFVRAPFIPMGIKVSTDDLAFALLAAALVMRVLFFELPRRQAVYGIWLAIGAVFFISFGLGLSIFGTAAGVEARPNFYFWMAGLYFASFSYSPETLKKMWRITQWCAWLVAAIVVYRWVGLKLGFVSERLVEFAGASSEFRVVGSNPTFFMGAMGVAYFALWLRHSRRMALLAALVMLGLVLVLQHRSVWVATFGALALVAWHQRAAIAAKAFPIIGMGVAMVGIMAILIALNPSNRLTETITRSAVSVTESHGTHTDRLEGWRVLLTDYVGYSPGEWMLGKPYGTGYERYSGGSLRSYSPHNFYIQLLLRLGAIGVLLFLWAHFILRSRVRRIAADSSDSTLLTVLLAVLAANLLYYIPYQGFYLQGAFYGVLIGYLATSSPATARHANAQRVFGFETAK